MAGVIKSAQTGARVRPLFAPARMAQEQTVALAVLPSAQDAAALALAAAMPQDIALEQQRAELAMKVSELLVYRQGLRREMDDLTAQARRAADERGYMDGQERALRTAREGVQSELRRLRQVVDELGRQQLARAKEAEDMLVEIVFAAVCKLMAELAPQPASIRHWVQQAIGEVAGRDVLRVRLHPADLVLLEQDGDPMTDVNLSADPVVALGGCMVDSAAGSLDLRLETQLALLAQALSVTRDVRRRRPGAQ